MTVCQFHEKRSINRQICFVGLLGWLLLVGPEDSLAQQSVMPVFQGEKSNMPTFGAESFRVDRPAEWDVEKIREEGNKFLFESLPTFGNSAEEYTKKSIELTVKEGRFRLELEDLSDHEIRSLCDYRSVLKQQGEDILECPRMRDRFKGMPVFGAKEIFPRAADGERVRTRILGSSQPEPPRAFYWNAWVDTRKTQPCVESKESCQPLAFSPLKLLEPGHEYLLALDLSAYEYKPEESAVASEQASPALAELLKDLSKLPDELEILLLHDKVYFDPPKMSVKSFKLCKENIRNRVSIKPENKPFRARTKSTKECAPDFLFGHVFLQIATKENVQGPTSLGLSVWSKGRPVDEISLQICVADKPEMCAGLTAPRLSFKGIDSLRVGKTNTSPDAALHFLVKDPKEGVIGVFRRNDNDADKKFYSWPLELPSHDLIKKFSEKLIPEIEKVAVNPRNTTDALAAEAKTVYEALFPATTQESKDARKAFEAFVAKFIDGKLTSAKHSPPSIFVRMIQEGSEPPLPIPLGLIPIKDKFLGEYFRIESPLERQNYDPGEGCITNWILVAPTEDGPMDGILQQAFAKASETLSKLRDGMEKDLDLRTGKDFESIGDPQKGFRAWVRNQYPRVDPPTALMVLSHHDSDALYFDKDRDHSVLSDSVNRDFGKPSVAILNGCGTGGGGARYLIRRFNQKGFPTIIALSTQVGAELAGDYLGCLVAELRKNVNADGSPKGEEELTPISAAHHNAITKCLIEKPEGGKDVPKYGPRVFAYTVLGNGSLRLCPPKNEVPYAPSPSQ